VVDERGLFCDYMAIKIMKIVHVIPIAKGVPSKKLSYFTAKDVEAGALVLIPIRNRNIPALVDSVEDVKDMKSSLRKSDFNLKKIKSVKSSEFLRPEFVSACKEIAIYFMSGPGTAIKNFVPQAVLDGLSEKKSGEIGLNTKNKKETVKESRHSISIIYGLKEERLQHYRSVIRENFAKNKSVFFCLPTISDIMDFSSHLKKGIENYTFVLHNKLPKKKIVEEWEKAISENHPILIIATKSFLGLPRRDISNIILDYENSSAYKSQTRPYIDARKSVEIISKHIGSRLIFGDTFARSETAYRQESGEFHSPPIAASRPRVLSEADQVLVNMKELDAPASEEKRSTFTIISPQLLKVLNKTLKYNEKSILFINRKGHSPTTICMDCKRTILCEKCDSPMVLHKIKSDKKFSTTEEKFFFSCHKCFMETPAMDSCPYCGSWQLKSMGVGLQKITDELAAAMPELKIFTMDSESIKTEKQGQNLIKDFINSPGSVLVGTELIFSFIKEPVERVAIVSVDPLFTLPEFRINEKIFYLLLKLRSLAKKTFLIQTRMPDKSIFQYALRGNVSGFYKEEIENRKLFNYPPFKLLIKLIRESDDEKNLDKETSAAEELLKEWKPTAYRAFIPKIKNLFRQYILIKINPSDWPPKMPEKSEEDSAQTREERKDYEKLYNTIASLAGVWKIDIDPESLL